MFRWKKKQDDPESTAKKPPKKQSSKQQDAQKKQIKSKATMLSATFALTEITSLSIFSILLILAILGILFTLALLGLALYAAMKVNDYHADCKHHIRFDEEHGKRRCLKNFNFIEDTERMIFVLAQFAIALWNLCLPFLTWILILAYDGISYLGKLLFGGALRKPVMETIAVLTETAAWVSSGLSKGLGGTVPTVGSSVTENILLGSVGGSNINFGASSSTGDVLWSLIQFVLLKCSAFFNGVGGGIYRAIDAIDVWFKHLPKLLKSLIDISQLFNSDNGAITKTLKSVVDYQYVAAGTTYEFCKVQKSTIKSTCNAVDSISSAFKKLGVDVGGCPKSLNVDTKCTKPGKKKSSGSTKVGAGLCNEFLCESNALTLLDVIQAQMPYCNDWALNGTSQIDCMNVVHQFSLANTTASSSSSSFDTISKEFCFVVTSTVQAQCLITPLTPFAFDFNAVAFDVCVADKSGLGIQSFNGRCACPYQQPLCPLDCCQQYMLHVNGQVMSHLGTQQCAYITSVYPDSFWCQYDNFTAADIPAASDYSFSAGWCSYYRRYLKPLCTTNPYVNLQNAAALPGSVDLLTGAFVNVTCNAISNQQGVCVAYDINTDPDLFDIRHANTNIDFSEVVQQNNLAGYTPAVVITVPTDDITDPNTIIEMNSNKYACKFFARKYNLTNYQLLYDGDSVEGFLASYCEQKFKTDYYSLNFETQLGPQILTVDGTKIPTVLDGLGSDVPVFGATTLTTTDTQTDNQNVCPDGALNTNQEAASQVSCADASMQQQMDSLDTLGSAQASSEDDLASVSETSSSFAYLGSVSGSSSTSGALTPQQQQESNSLNEAQSVNDNYESVQTDTYQPDPVKFRFYSADPPGDHSSQKHSSVLFQFKGGQRAPLSLESEPEPIPEENEQETRPKGILESLRDLIERNYNRRVEWANQRKEIRGSLMASLHRKLEDMGDRGQQRQAHDYFKALYVRKLEHTIGFAMDTLENCLDIDLDMIDTGLVSVDSSEFMEETLMHLGYDTSDSAADGEGSTNRKLFSLTNNAELDAKIIAAIRNIGRLNIENPGISPEDFDYFLNVAAENKFRQIYRVLTTFLIPNIIELTDVFFENRNNDQFFEMLGATAANSTEKNCKNSNNHPYDCCTNPILDPYSCCKGLTGCIPLLSNIFMVMRTTYETLHRWLCPLFEKWNDYYYNTFRTLYTGTVMFIVNPMIPHHNQVRNAIDWFAYPHYKMPDNAFNCMVADSHFIFLLIIILMLVAASATVFISSGLMLLMREDITRLNEQREMSEIVNEVVINQRK